MNVFCLTIDTDWVPDEVLQFTIDLLNKEGINATFFCTNKTDCDFGNHEVALHPNFTSFDLEKHLSELLSLFPEAKGLRSHSLFFTERLRPLLAQKEIFYTSNMMLFEGSQLAPCMISPSTVEFPIYFMDTFNIIMKGANATFQNDIEKLLTDGLKVYDFHPIHIFMNTASFDHYDSFKSVYHDTNALKKYINYATYGIRDYFLELLKYISSNNCNHSTLIELCAKHRKIQHAGNNNR